MTQEEIKAVITELLKLVKREGMDNLIKYLETSDFYTAPASTKFHNNFVGGLAGHSLNVYYLLSNKVKQHNISVPEQSIILSALLHDLCKIDTYKTELKWKKDDNNKWYQEEVWVVKDSFPIGHGEKSVIMAQRFIQLTDEEITAIRWHLAMSDPGTHFAYPTGHSFKEAFGSCPLLVCLSTSDVEASFLVESRPAEKIST